MGSIDGGCKQDEDDQTAQADLPTQVKGFVLIGKGNRMLSFRHGNANHDIPNQHRLNFFSVNGNMPVAVLGDGGVQETVAIGVDGTFHIGRGEFRQFQRGFCQNLIGLPEQFVIQQTGVDIDGAAFTGLAVEPDLHHIAGLELGNREHLRQGIGLYIQVCAVEINIETIAHGLIHIDAQKTCAVSDIRIDATIPEEGVAKKILKEIRK